MKAAKMPSAALHGAEKETVEVENNDDVISKNPYDPDLIRVDSRVYSLHQILDMIESKELDLAPDFQRNLVWNQRRQSRLIESILLRIPLPAFYFDADKQGSLSVIDGIQRLSAVLEYVNGEYKLQDVEYLRQLDGKSYGDLDPIWTRRIRQTQINANVIDPQTPSLVKFDIFRRINTGGLPLNAQELRHCIGRFRSRDILRSWAALPAFLRATNKAIKDHTRMKDREAVLRFVAFRMVWPNIKEHYGPSTLLDDFLTTAMRRLDDPKQVPDILLRRLESDFKQAMENAWLLFGKHAFRKWPEGDNRSSPLNIALLESWAVPLADYQAAQLEPHREMIVSTARANMKPDQGYFKSVTGGTSDHKAVLQRFATARDILRASLR